MATTSDDTSDDFRISGPVHMSTPNWGSQDDQRVVLASLVKATYVLESDRNEKRIGPEALAPAWWEHFNFELVEELEDVHDSYTFGCVYEYKPPFHHEDHEDHSAPRFVVTFRGTMLDSMHGLMAVTCDLLVAIGGLNNSLCVHTAVESISKYISITGNPEDVWIGGHSLGASIATVAGKHMIATENIYLKTFLFNPPFPSILNWIPEDLNLEKLKQILRTVKRNIEVSLACINKDYCIKTREEFEKLAAWKPYLFVNAGDPISKSYISYFERRKNMEGDTLEHTGSLLETLKQMVTTRIEQLDTRTSLMEILTGVFGSGLERLHLLPSACLAENLNKLGESHGILQWWRQDISLRYI